LIFPMLAASLVMTTSPDMARNSGHFAQEISFEKMDVTTLADIAGGQNAKRPSRGRGRSLSVKAFEGADDDDGMAEVAAAPTRASKFVCPSDMVMIGRSYCVDTFEASLLESTDSGDKPWPYYEVLPEGVRVRAVSVAGVFPQGYISGVQAAAACEASGKRLCKPAEWKKACMGPKKTIFPYGNTRETGVCNDNGRSAMHFFNKDLDDKPEHRWMWGFDGNMTDPRLNQLEGTLTRTGERTGCTNEYGVFDMVGNLHEWVDDPDGTFQGGYYLDTHLNGDGCFYRTTAHPVSHLDYSTGFRCCADVDDL
jgi:hypothetical protein